MGTSSNPTTTFRSFHTYFLGGKCRHCKKPISLRYPLVELITGLLFVANYLQLGLAFHLLLNLILTCTLIIITFIDIDTLIINDRFHVIISARHHVTSPDLLQSSLIGAFIISIPFLLIAGLTGGLGGGDVKLMAVAGLYLGWQNVLVSFFIASITGGLYAIYLILFKKQGKSRNALWSLPLSRNTDRQSLRH